MNRDDIIRMARVEGVFVESSAWLTPTPDLEERVYQFAALVAAAEREACIEDCEALGDSWRQWYLDGVKSCIAVIRARGEK